ncbi:MAG: hypothetical protein U1E34_00940 [Amaricoccus sp.]
MSDWNAASVQVVWFSADAHGLDASDLFATMAGAPAISTNHNSAPTPANPRFSSASGELNGVAFEIGVQFGRIDFVVQRPASDGQIVPELFADTPALLTDTIVKVKRLTGTVPSVNRLALVLQLGNFAGSHPKCTQLVNQSIGNAVDYEGISDLMLQVNRRFKATDTTELEMNRLLRFSVLQIQQVFLDAARATMAGTQELFMASFMVDLNTVPTTRAIDVAEQNRIWDTLAAEALRLRDVGSIEGLGEQ